MKVKLLTGTSIVAVIACICMGILFYMKTEQYFLSQKQEEVQGLAQIGAGYVDPTQLVTIETGMEDDITYKDIIQKLRNVLQYDKAEYIYIMRKTPDGIFFWVDADEEDPANIMEPYNDTSEAMNQAFLSVAGADEEILTDEWGSFLSGYAPVLDPSGNVIAIVGVDCTAINIINSMKNFRMIIIITVAAAIIFIILLNGILVNRISKGIRIIIKKMDDVIHSDGNLTQKVEMHTGDELEIVADLLNEFIEDLRQIIKGLSNSSVLMNQYADELDSGVDGVHTNIVGITSSMHELAAIFEETTASMQEIGSVTDHVAQKAKEIHKDTKDGSNYASEVKQRAERLTDKALKVQKETEARIQKLDTEITGKIASANNTKSISEITGQIIAISSRTNILSLNASIEAARVGEQGKGFAVVAQDVAKLAKESKNAAEQILAVSGETERAINELIHASNDLICFIKENVLNTYQEFVHNGAQYNTDAKMIAEYMQRITNQAIAIDESMDSITKSVSNVNLAMDESNRNLQKLNESSAEISESMNTVTNTAQNSKGIARDIDLTVKKFVV